MTQEVNRKNVLSSQGVNVLSLFDGMACGMLAMQKAGLKVNNYYAYEIDKYAIKTVLHNFPDVKELGNVFDEDFSKYEGIDFLVGGSPCVPAGSKVKTDKGYKNIEDMCIGDMVLTHRNRYRPVSRLYKRNTNHLYHLKFNGNVTLDITGNHPVYTYRNNKFEFVRTDELTTDDYITININQNNNALEYSDDILWLVGRALADGYLSAEKNAVIISVGKTKTEEFVNHLNNISYYVTHKDRSAPEYVINNIGLTELYSYFGNNKALDKFIPDTILNLPKNQLKIVFDGYISGDGFIRKDKPNTVMWCSSSNNLILSMGLLTAKLFNKYPTTTMRLGEYKKLPSGMCQTHDSYNSQISITDRHNSDVKVVGDKILIRIKSIEKEDISTNVYNIETAEDHSYTVNNCIVHNCTYWSIAQSPDKRETTASGMGWELFSQYVRAIKEAKPKYFIYENNKSMAKAIYESISETFGFEPIMINSALLSAQNRQRYYWVGKRNEDGTYSKVDIEQPEDKGILLKDILDGVIRFSRKNGICEAKDKALAICASDWCGINRNQLQNAVVEPVNTTSEGKAQCLRATCYKDGIRNLVANDVDRRTAVAEPVGTTKDGKSYCLTSGYSNGSGENIGNYVAHTLEKGCKSMVAEPVACRCRGRIDKDGNGYAKYECREDGKANTLDTNTVNGAMVAEPVNTTPDGKSQTLKAQYSKTDINNICRYKSTYGASDVAEPVRVCTIDNHQGNRIYSVDGKSICLEATGGGLGGQTGLYAQPVNTSVQVGALPRPNGELSKSQAFRIYDTNAKSVTLKAGGGGAGGKTGLYAIPIEFDGDIPTKAVSYADGKTYKVHEVKDGLITIKEKQYPIKLQDGYYIIRKLTISECKRLQTVPEWYEFPVSDTQGYKMLGNSWTVDVIVHLIKSTINKDSDKGEINDY